MKKLIAFGNVANGVLTIRNRSVFDAELATLSGEVDITIQKRGRKRSNQQNRYYHGVVIPIIKNALKDLGNDLSNEDIHEFLKHKFNPKEIILNDTGETFDYGASTTEMNTIDFMVYIDKIQKFSASILNTFIPDPEWPI
jgi:hypothetical protein